MAKNYRVHSTGGSFKRQDCGDLGLRSFKEQQKELIDALKLQQARAHEYGDDYIEDLKGVGRTEAENRRNLKELENKVYQAKREALTKRAETEVSFIRSQADEAGRKSDFWKDFSTTYSKQFGKLAQGLTDYADYRDSKETMDEALSTSAKEFLTYETGEQIIAKNLSKSVDKTDDVFTAKNTNALHLKRNDIHGKTVLAHYQKTSDVTFDVFKLRLKDSGHKLTASSGPEYGSNYIYNYLVAHKIRPNSKAGREITERWDAKVLTEITKNTLTAEADEDEKRTQGFLNAFQNNPTTENIHNLVRHVQLRTYKDEDGRIHQTTVKRNPAESWIEVAELLIKYGDTSLGWMQSWDQFHKTVFKHLALPDKKGIPSKEWFDKKGESRISELKTRFTALRTKDITEEQARVKLEKELIPINDINVEISEKGRENTLHDWSDNGWVVTNRKSLQTAGNLEAEKQFEDIIGYDRSKHSEFEEHRQFMDSLDDNSLEGRRRSLYLLGLKFDKNSTFNIKGYTNLELMENDIKDYLTSGVFTNSDRRAWAPNLVKGQYRTKNVTDKMLDNHALTVIDKLEDSRAYYFNELNAEDFRNPQDRLLKAERMAEDEFERGLKGQGRFAAKPPEVGENSNWKVRWVNFNNPDETQPLLNATEMIDKFSSEGFGMSDITEYEKTLATKTELNNFVSNIIEGYPLRNKIPSNVVLYAHMRRMDPKKVMNRLLEKNGFKIRVPVGPDDQLKASSEKWRNTEGKIQKRHTESMMMWKAYVKEQATTDPTWRPQPGLGGNQDFNKWRQNKTLAVSLVQQPLSPTQFSTTPEGLPSVSGLNQGATFNPWKSQEKPLSDGWSPKVQERKNIGDGYGS